MTAVIGPPPGLDATIGEGQAWLEARMFDQAVECPCCTQNVKVYRRRINHSQAVALIRAWREHGREWFHLATLDKSREASKLGHWGLMAHDMRPREDGGQSGWWKITDDGEKWVRNVSTVVKYVLLYDDRVQRFEGPGVSIVDALGKRFDYRELMTA